MPSSADWHALFDSFGWLSCPLLFPVCEPLVTDNPVASASVPTATRSFSVGLPHPQYGIMRATAFLTDAPSLTRLVSIVHPVAALECSANESLPHLYLGAHPFVDRVGSQECLVLGVLVFASSHGYGHLGASVQYAPLTLARWQGTWLPYFEDANQWVMTGWNRSGRVTEIFKPFGWGCRLHAPGAAPAESSGSRCASHEPSLDDSVAP